MSTRTAKALSAYPFERQYLDQTNNEARFYLNGKGIVRKSNGKLFSFVVEDDELEFFDFGGTLLDEFLTEISLMNPEEAKQLKLLQDLDKGLAALGLHAVSGVFALNTQSEEYLKDLIIIEPESRAYFRFDLLELDNISEDTVKILGTFPACPLSKPYDVTISEDGSVQHKK